MSHTFIKSLIHLWIASARVVTEFRLNIHFFPRGIPLLQKKRCVSFMQIAEQSRRNRKLDPGHVSSVLLAARPTHSNAFPSIFAKSQLC